MSFVFCNLSERSDFIFVNSSSCSVSQRKTFPLPSKSLMSLVLWAKSGMKKFSWFARPRKDFIPVWSFGEGKFRMAATLSWLGWTSWLESMYPAKGRVDPMTNFFLDRTMFQILHREEISSIRDCNVVISGAQMRISSTIFLDHNSPSTTASLLLHHSSEEALRPCGMRRYRYLPEGSIKVVNIELSSSRGIWKYPLTASNLAKKFASDGIDWRMSKTLGKGWTGVCQHRNSILYNL